MHFSKFYTFGGKDIMPDRLKHSGHYKLKFFVTPHEFNDILKLFERKQTKFIIPNYARTEHDTKQINDSYARFYNYYTSEDKPTCASFVYSISFNIGNEKGGFFIVDEDIRFPYCKQFAADKLCCLTFSCVKGIQIDLEDEKGKYYIYEDIRNHRPLTYVFFNEVTAYIKGITKPFRFFALTGDSYQQQKPAAVRISSKALSELSEGWIFKKYQLQTPDFYKSNNT